MITENGEFRSHCKLYACCSEQVLSGTPENVLHLGLHVLSQLPQETEGVEYACTFLCHPKL